MVSVAPQGAFGQQRLGGSSGGGTPLPISNRAVKPASADGSACKLTGARVGRRQDFAVQRSHGAPHGGRLLLLTCAFCWSILAS